MHILIMLSRQEIYKMVAEYKISREEAKELLNQGNKKDSSHELSIGQKELYSIYFQDNSGFAYNVPIAFKINQKVDSSKLKKAIEQIVYENYSLRSCFIIQDNKPKQVIQDKAELFMKIEDATICKYEEIVNKINELSKEPFDLENGPIFKTYLYKMKEDSYILFLNFHHIIFDGISLTIFLKELQENYISFIKTNKKFKRKEKASYNEFIKWQVEILQSSKGYGYRKFWKEYLSGELPKLDIYTGKIKEKRLQGRGSSISTNLNAKVIEKLKGIAENYNVSIFNIMFSAYFVLLYRLTGKDDLIVATPMIVRPKKEFENIIGYFINMLPIRVKIDEKMTFIKFVEYFKNNIFSVYDNMFLPYDNIIKTLPQSNELKLSQIYETTFHFQSWVKYAENLGENENELNFEIIDKVHQQGEFPLSLEVYQQKDGMDVLIKFDPDIYDDYLAEEILTCYKEIISSITENINADISKINILSKEECNKILVDWNDTKATYPKDKCIYEIIDEVALNNSTNIAIVDYSKNITYKSLYENSNRVANYLREKGIKTGDYILVLLEPSIEMITLLIGILKAGGAYVPLDVNIPKDRLNFIMNDIDNTVVVTDDKLGSMIDNEACTIININDLIDNLNNYNTTLDFDNKVKNNNVAYVIYTSGSTGNPKGVEIYHKGLTNVIFAMDNIHHFMENDRILFITTLCFDIAEVELYLPLIKGGSIEIVSLDVKKDGIALREQIESSEATYLQATPATWEMIIYAGWNKKKNCKIITAGEALSRNLASQLLKRCDELWNQYGPTENTIYTTVAHITDENDITIGRPIINNKIYIFDKYMNIVPIGFPGEMYIGGDCLAKGYLKRDDLNKKAFIISPLNNQERLYKTGDIVRYLPNKNIDYLGRADKQIKIRGYRIEIEEIENNILKDENVEQCVVVLKKNSIGNKKLVAFLKIKDINKTLALAERKKILKKWLPEYMIPSLFVELNSFPVTLSGKINRKELSETDIDEVIKKYKDDNVQKKNEPKKIIKESNVSKDIKINDVLISIVSEIMNMPIEKININDNIGDYGFDSITYTILSTKINNYFNIEIRAIIFYEIFTIKKIGEYLIENYKYKVLEKTTISEVSVTKKDEIIINNNSNRKDIAIIGMSAKMPDSDDYDDFWNELLKQKDFVKVIPKERWDAEKYYGDPNSGNKSLSKWGSFMEDIDCFDNEFFGISPREAENMDPQQRLIIEEVWKCVEDAGYKMSYYSDSSTGVYIGASSVDYGEVCKASHQEIEAHAATGISKTIIANRISYLFNLHGPSITIDTACSSSLVAMDLAVKSIRNGDCNEAIVGGINIMLDPMVYVALSKGGMLSPDGRCKAFDNSANGYVRGEGCISFLLKPLDKAKVDGDNIYAVIKGSAQNHSGKTSSLTAPNPKAQADLIERAMNDADVSPDTISYIEAHGTGTRLGDPIEIEGLKKAFNQYYQNHNMIINNNFKCGIGSIKSNLGHLEGAAGIAGVLKVILAMQHKKIPASLHINNINDNISLENTPFYLVVNSKDWTSTDNKLRAGVSAFGFGGLNAHVILEKYINKNEDVVVSQGMEVAIFSANDTEDIINNSRKYLKWIKLNKNLSSYNDFIYTLKVGREAMKTKIAIFSSNFDELSNELKSIVEGDFSSKNIITNISKEDSNLRFMEELLNGNETNELINSIIAKGDKKKISQLWVSGVNINWDVEYGMIKMKRLHLPTYEFKKYSYWFKSSGENVNDKALDAESTEKLQLINCSTFTTQKYRNNIEGNEFFLRNHVIFGDSILPGVIYIEIARKACEDACNGNNVYAMKKISLQRPIIYRNSSISMFTELEYQENNIISYKIYSENENNIHSEGLIDYNYEKFEEDSYYDFNQILSRCNNSIDSEELYDYFNSLNVNYGTAFRTVSKVHYNEFEAIAFVNIPESRRNDFNDYVLIPSLLDGSLQTVTAINFDFNNKNSYYPYEIGELIKYNDMTENIFVYAKAKNETEGIVTFDIKIMDETGKLLIDIFDYSLRRVEKNNDENERLKVEILKRINTGLLSEEEAEMLIEELKL